METSLKAKGGKGKDALSKKGGKLDTTKVIASAV
jgi:hypothetical protein